MLVHENQSIKSGIYYPSVYFVNNKKVAWINYLREKKHPQFCYR